jgi:hypothetical protein
MFFFQCVLLMIIEVRMMDYILALKLLYSLMLKILKLEIPYYKIGGRVRGGWHQRVNTYISRLTHSGKFKV